ncbi:diaminopimelate decarboxylase [Amycolatopsis lurida]|uniref:Amino acid decarboxylase n=1 Tax=Amycolatopsis lurida NRRL 2430 TaxID=1460371 RepID=A0A2P2FGK9_AMYLU|nr:alanine racemase [Amycolatopsis lurida]KFU75852.1 amino acid decarboxylase [Amycolatopsis lurida NRRL 2430]SEE33582.1 diaminopimelate decarboxylase [Amycolatopsis lurida]
MDLIDTLSPPLPALERPWAPRLRASETLWEIARAVGGGPFHVVHPATFAENLGGMVAALAAERVEGTVYYGKKANKAAAWLRECTRPGAGVDVASVPELVHALGNGLRGETIGVTGAAKPDGLLWLALRHRCLIAVDAADELERVARLAAELGETAQVLLRVRPPSAPESRFGFAPDALKTAVRQCGGPVVLRGFSFHLDGYDPVPRAELAAYLIDLCQDARALGQPASKISIGGGIAVSYVDSGDWARFESGRHDGWFHAGRNPSKTYPYHQAPVGAAMVTTILRHEIAGKPLAERLRAAGIELLLEPGRALVDGAGFSVFPVLGCKPAENHLITTVAGLSMSLSEQWKGSEFLPDPVLVRREAGEGTPVRTVVAGSSCMEYDVLTWRAVELPARPRTGDLLVYPSTAGYQMDKNESGFHQLPLPPKVVVDGDRWHVDTDYPIQEIR